MDVLVGVGQVVVLSYMQIVQVVGLENRSSFAVVILLGTAVILSKTLQDRRVALVLAQQY
jgi:hypothetical protein